MAQKAGRSGYLLLGHLGVGVAGSIPFHFKGNLYLLGLKKVADHVTEPPEEMSGATKNGGFAPEIFIIRFHNADSFDKVNNKNNG